MPSFDNILRSLWRLVPGRDRLRKTAPYILLRSAYYRLRWWGVSHDRIFDREYFEFVERTTGNSADVIAASILENFQPASVIDVGCGTGALLERLRRQSVAVRGYERASAALEFCRDRGLDVTSFNILDDLPRLDGRSDVAVCMEVGHQLPAAAADKLVGLLCFLAPQVVFSSETPGGGDRCSWNERPHEYWISKFRQHDFRFDKERTEAWKDAWERKNVAPWFCKNLLLFTSVND